MNKTSNIIMTVVAAAVFVALNVGVFMAAGSGVISPINNVLLWGVFVVLNVASILWATSLLGLQPLVVAVSYVAGGTLAYLGVRGMNDVSVAEIITAGSTYGAFGALAIGNTTMKVRLAFFNKAQVPFIFIIAGLLVVDAVLNSQVASAGTGVLLNAVLLPFAIAGVAVGAIWSLLNRFGIGKASNEKLAAQEVAQTNVETEKAGAGKKVVIPMPERKAKEKVSAPVVKPKRVAAKASGQKAKKEKAFSPKADKADDSLQPVDKTVRKESKPSFEAPVFDAELYASGSEDNGRDGGVLVKEPAASVEAKPVTAAVEPEPAEKEAQETDWLGGHLDLLNKLK